MWRILSSACAQATPCLGFILYSALDITSSEFLENDRLFQNLHPPRSYSMSAIPYVSTSRAAHPDFRGPPRKMAHEVWQNAQARAGARRGFLCRHVGEAWTVLVQLSPCIVLTGSLLVSPRLLVSPLSRLEKSQLASGKISSGLFVLLLPKILVAT